MSRILLDTSTLIDLSYYIRSKVDLYGCDKLTGVSFIEHSSLESAIEAIILYDEILIDQPSFRRNSELDPELFRFVQKADFIFPVDYNGPQDYLIISEKINSILESMQDLEPASLHEIQQNLTGTTSANLLYHASLNREEYDKWHSLNSPSSSPKTLEDQVIYYIRQRFENSDQELNTFRKVQLTRYFYYLYLQEKLDSALVIHPYKMLWTDQKMVEDSENEPIRRVFDQFEETRRVIAARNKEWFGIEDD